MNYSCPCLYSAHYRTSGYIGRPGRWVTDEALSQSVISSSFGKPHPQDLDFLRTWQRKATAANVVLIGQDHDVWEKGEDLMALQPRHSSDPFSEWLTGGFVYWFYQKIVFKVSPSPIRTFFYLVHPKWRSCEENLSRQGRRIETLSGYFLPITLSLSVGPRKSRASNQRQRIDDRPARGLLRAGIRQQTDPNRRPNHDGHILRHSHRLRHHSVFRAQHDRSARHPRRLHRFIFLDAGGNDGIEEGGNLCCHCCVRTFSL